MTWLYILITVIAFVLLKFIIDSKKEQKKIIGKGGMKEVFPEFVTFFEDNDFEFVEETGSKLLYKKSVFSYAGYEDYLFLGIESKFTNIAYGYIMTGHGIKMNGINVEFRRNCNPEDIDLIIRKIAGSLKIDDSRLYKKKVVSKSNVNTDKLKLFSDFEKVEWTFDFDSEIDNIFISFTNSYGDTKVIRKDADFDFGSIILIDANKSINELIENLNFQNFSLLPKKGRAYLNESNQIFIKGWNAEEFIAFQYHVMEKEKKKKQTQPEVKERIDILPFLLRHNTFSIDMFSRHFPMSEALINKYQDTLDWDSISSNRKLKWSDSFIEQYQDYFNWDNISGNESFPWSERYFHEYENFLSFTAMADNPKISWTKNLIQQCAKDISELNYLFAEGQLPWSIEFIDDIYDLVQWDELSSNGNVNWNIKLLERFSDKLNWEALSGNPSLVITPDMLKKFNSKFNFDRLFQNESFWMNDELRRKYYDHIPWNEYSGYERVIWKESFIEENSKKFNWNILSANSSLPWSNEFYQKYKNLISLYCASINKSFPWTEEFIDRHKNELNWAKDYTGLSNNDGLSWSIQLIEKFEDRWEYGHFQKNTDHTTTIFDGLGNRQTIPWSILLLEKFEHKWDFRILLMNHSVWHKAFSNINEALLRMYLDRV